MDLTVEPTPDSNTSRRTAEIVLAALLHDIGKVFQRADWPLSQAAEKLQEDLCPIVEGRPVHRHVLWTYDFCNDNLKWLADYVDLAQVIRLATEHHRSDFAADVQGAVLDAANRLAAGHDPLEIEELQPVIPPQVPLESILWRLSAPESPGSRRVRQGSAAGHAISGGPQGQVVVEAQGQGSGAPAASADGQGPGAAPGEGEPPAGPAREASEARAPLLRKGYIKAQLLRPEDQILPQPGRPEMNEQDYRAIGADLVAAVQKIGRTSARPRLGWLVEALRGTLERRVSLVPAYVGAGGQNVSLYSHGAAAAALAAALWTGQARRGGPGDKQARCVSLTAVAILGVDESLWRPTVTEDSSRVYHGRAVQARLIARLASDVLLGQLGLTSVNRLWEGDAGFVVLADAEESTLEAIRRFAAEQGRRLFEQSGGHLQLAVGEPVAVGAWQLGPACLRAGGAGWAGTVEQLRGNLEAAKSRLCAQMLQDSGGWREDAAVLALVDRRGGQQDPGEWAKLQEAYERQLGSNLAKGKTIAAYSSPVTPAGVEGEPTAIGPWFVHVAASPEGLVGWEGLEAIYTMGEADEPWAWVPAWPGLPHGPTFRRADESQLRADPSPELLRTGGVPRRRETPIGFEELGWLARRSRKGRGFVGRSWLACLRVQAQGIRADGADLARRCAGLAEALEAVRLAGWFWQEFLEAQLRRADRATWRVFVLRCSPGRAILIGPWNTMTVLAGRAEQWWRRWVGSTQAWPLHGAMVFGARDVPVWQLAWQAGDGPAAAEQASEAGRLELFGRACTWVGYREALRLAALLAEQVQWPELLADDGGLTFLRRLLTQAQVAQAQRARTAWRAQLAQDTRKLVLRRLPRRGKRTADQEDVVRRLQDMVMAGRRGRVSGSAMLAARFALWQNQGESS